MWEPRTYIAVCCVGLLARGRYPEALEEYTWEPAGWGAVFTLWIPIAVLVV
jgi:hypothetical protein